MKSRLISIASTNRRPIRNMGLKDHQPVKDEMERCMIEVAPHGQGRHLLMAAE